MELLIVFFAVSAFVRALARQNILKGVMVTLGILAGRILIAYLLFVLTQPAMVWLFTRYGVAQWLPLTEVVFKTILWFVFVILDELKSLFRLIVRKFVVYLADSEEYVRVLYDWANEYRPLITFVIAYIEAIRRRLDYTKIIPKED